LKTFLPVHIALVMASATLVHPPARAATYYVSQSSGNDAWNGQAVGPQGVRGPWKTLGRASIEYKAGDSILLKCGDTWNETFRPKGNGTASRPIVIGSYGKGDKPVIDRQDDRKDLAGIHLVDQGGFKIVGIEFARCMTGIYGEYSVDCPIRRFIRIEDCYFHDALLYQHYEDYPKRKIGLGVCFFSHERKNRIVLADVAVKNCVFRRLASGFWTNSPDNFNKYAGKVYNFADFVFEDCLFEEGYQWQLGIRGVDGGAVRNCVTHDIGRGFRSFNGVAGAMFFRCKDWVFEDSEWGFIDIGLGSGDGEAFDFEGVCDNMTMSRCLFHDTDGPGFLLCCYASAPEPNMGIVMQDCVLNGKAKRPIGLPRCEIINTTDWNEVTWKNCRFYLSKGEILMKVMDPEKEKRTKFVDCLVKHLSDACSTPDLAARARASASSAASRARQGIDGDPATVWRADSRANEWLQIEFARPTRINEFRISEAPDSSIIRYSIDCWDAGKSKWVSCFNGRRIGPDFVAPIVDRTTRKARLFVRKTAGGNPGIAEFAAHNDRTGGVALSAVGRAGPTRPSARLPARTPSKPLDYPATVTVRNPGNRADATSYGSVAYTYRIGRYEVTNTEYCEFLNAVAGTDPHRLYHGGMAGEYGGIIRHQLTSGRFAYRLKPGMERKPVNYVSFFDAVRFANWLGNGKGSGETETGSYRLQGLKMPDHAALARGRKAKWVLASEDEWYKAAYYDPEKPGGAGYWRYATRGDNTPAVAVADDTAPGANYNTNQPNDVGALSKSASAYGTFDQNGNMWEWNETSANGRGRGLRGGSFYLNDRPLFMQAATRYDNIPPTDEHPNYGFRVVALGGTAR
jgi:formylglycine-generating enzyme